MAIIRYFAAPRPFSKHAMPEGIVAQGTLDLVHASSVGRTTPGSSRTPALMKTTEVSSGDEVSICEPQDLQKLRVNSKPLPPIFV
jgi:hypothetical protein